MVNQTLGSVGLSPAGPTLDNGQTQQFTATARDQFGNAMATQPSFAWSVDADADAADGTITPGGLYTAPAAGTGSDTVRAVGGGLEGTSTLSISNSAVPAAPSGLTATAVSASRIDLAWTDNSNNEEGFRIQRLNNATSQWETITELAAGVTGYSHTGLAASTTYRYRVCAFNSGGSNCSGEIEATTEPNANTSINLTASATSESQIDLAWTHNIAGVEGYRLEVSFNGSDFFEVSTNGPGFSTASAVELEPGQTFYYRIIAFNATSDLGLSNTAVATTLGGGVGLLAVASTENEPAPLITTQASTTNLLLAFNGARLGGQPVGNEFFEQMIQDAGGTVRENGLSYADFVGPEGRNRLFDVIDTNDDFTLTQGEIGAVTVRIAGYSWGAVTAVNVSRQLSAVDELIGSYTLEAPVPVKALVLIDPVHEVGEDSWRIRHIHGPVKNNVEKFVNYYHRNKGTTSTIDFSLPGLGQYNNSDTYGTSFSTSLIGAIIPSGALNTTQTRVDTAWANIEIIQTYQRPGDPIETVYDGRLKGKNVNHDTMPWYVRGDALQDLKPPVQ